MSIKQTRYLKALYIYSSPDIPRAPNKKISIDIMGPFELTKSGNHYTHILVVQDYLTQYILIELIIDKSIASIIRALWYSWLRYFNKKNSYQTKHSGIHFE